MKIKRVDKGTRGEFQAIEDGNKIGEMSYYWKDEKTFAIDHTGVALEYEGQGVGKEMVKEAVNYARQNDCKIVPLCSFAYAVFQRKPEYSDVLEGN